MALSFEVIHEFPVIKSIGKLKTYDAFINFKTELDSIMKEALQHCEGILRLYFVQSYPINSYVLGYIFMLKNVDKLDIEIIVDDLKTFLFFEEIDLVELFKIKIMGA